MQLALELLLIGKLAAGGQDFVLRDEVRSIRPVVPLRRRRAIAARARNDTACGARGLQARHEAFQIALLLGGEIGGHDRYAAARCRSARPNTRSSRNAATEVPERIRSRYQRPSVVSP